MAGNERRRTTESGFTRNKKNGNPYHTTQRFPERAQASWVGPLVDYKEVELLRKFLTSSCKVMSRKRAGTSAREQAAVQAAIKRHLRQALSEETTVEEETKEIMRALLKIAQPDV